MKNIYDYQGKFLGIQLFRNGGVENWFGSDYKEFLEIKEEALLSISICKDSMILGYEYKHRETPTEYELLCDVINDLITLKEKMYF